MTSSSTPKGTALGVLALAREGRFDAIFDRLAAPLQSLVSADALREAWDAELRRCGAVVSVGEPLEEPVNAGVVVVKIPVSCQHGGLTLVVPVAEGGVLAGIQLAPPDGAVPTASWAPPAYVDPSAFAEREVTLGSGTLAVPGTLSLPAATGRHPAVVLLAGSGPLDRDGTFGPNKPLKDLAWGLASRGIAALRFDKVTFAHREVLRKVDGFTLTDEYVPAALAAAEELRREPSIDADRVFLAGHSLGGTAAPRVAAADGAVCGVVILAGGASPLHRSIVRQLRYLASLDEASAATAEPAAAVLERQADLIDSDRLSLSTPASDLPFGTPASYWLDLRSYDPVASARTLRGPILIVQGGRDYQVTVDDDLARWQAGLAGRPEVTVRVYPTANHLLARGSGPLTPAEYDMPQHVDPEVLADIAHWLTTAGAAAGTSRSRPQSASA